MQFYCVFLIKDIESDRSENKLVSHGRLVGFTNKYKDAGLCRVYNKSQLLLLCEAYGVRVTNRSNKTVLSNKLMEAIRTHACIPFIYPVISIYIGSIIRS